MPRRIIPVSSGKGGVGKTTFAINFSLCLSKIAPTILVDLDTGTSSVRNTLQSPVARDLYHFKRRGVMLHDCITRLGPELDPHSRYRNFGFIAGPRNFIQEIANPDEGFRRKLAEGIQRLPADYIVLDLRAGLDANVLDFLPYTNSGVLVFTPHHPTATIAASDIVKAILFRSLRILFGKGSTFYNRPGMDRFYSFINELLDRVEDVYDPSIPHLDAFLVQLREALGDHPIVHILAETLESFRVLYVMNMFNGVSEGFERAIIPFMDNLRSNISSRLTVTQLGWVVHDARIHEANCAGRAIVMEEERRHDLAATRRRRADLDPVMAELDRLESSILGLRRKPKPPAPKRLELDPLDADHLLKGQLATLEAMYSDRSRDTVRENFAHLVYRSLNLMSPSNSPHEFGMTQMSVPERLLNHYLARV